MTRLPNQIGWLTEGIVEVKGSFYTTVYHTYDSDIRTEEVVCNLCQGSAFLEIGRESCFSLRECRNCGLVYVNPQPVAEDIPKFYEGMYDVADSSEAARARSAGHIETHVSRTLAQRKPEGGRLLEIGCGYGRLLEVLRDQPWELHAFDVNENAVKHAQRNIPDASIETNTVEQASYPDGSFDCIVMIAVLEHLKNPHAILRRVRQWLAPGGIVLLQTPYVAPYIRMKRWIPFLPVNFEAPRHLFDFSPSVLRLLCESVGLQDPCVEVGRPYTSKTRLGMFLIWMVKIPGLTLYHLTRGWVYPFVGACLVHASKGTESD